MPEEPFYTTSFAIANACSGLRVEGPPFFLHARPYETSEDAKSVFGLSSRPSGHPWNSHCRWLMSSVVMVLPGWSRAVRVAGRRFGSANSTKPCLTPSVCSAVPSA